ncbi:hypothetical protein BJX99DRAFT_256229 [Aspergillus californicus]
MQSLKISDTEHQKKGQDGDDKPPPYLPSLARCLPVPDPPVFDNGRGIKFRDWSYLMIDTLEMNSGHYPTANHRVRYVISRIAGQPRDILLGRMQDPDFSRITDAESAMEFLAFLYQRHNPELVSAKLQAAVLETLDKAFTFESSQVMMCQSFVVPRALVSFVKNYPALKKGAFEDLYLACSEEAKRLDPKFK